MKKRLLDSLKFVRDVTVNSVTALGRGMRSLALRTKNFFLHPTIDQLIAADFGTHAGLFIVGALYAVGLVLGGQIIAGLAFAAFAGYYLWLMVKLSPWYTKMVMLARTQAEMLAAWIAGDVDLDKLLATAAA